MKPTASKWHRVWKCPASAVLPGVVDLNADQRSEWVRNRGKAIHQFLEHIGIEGVDYALALVPEEFRRYCAVLPLDDLPTHLSTEVAVAWNVRTRTARELGRNLGHRDYDTLPNPPTDDEIAGTYDLIGHEAAAAQGIKGYVGDWKFGRTRYPRPGQFGQTLMGALCVASLTKADSVVAELFHLREDGTHYAVRDTLDGWDLADAADQFERVFDLVEQYTMQWANGLEVPTVVGDHCAYCSARRSCPGTVGLIRELPTELVKLGLSISNDIELVRSSGPVLSVERAGVAYLAIERISDMLSEMKAEISRAAWHEDIPLPDGRVLGRTLRNERDVDGAVALQVLEARYGAQKARAAAKVKVPIAAIERLVADHKGTKEKFTTKNKTGALDLLLKEIEDAGGLTTTTEEVVRPFKPKRT